MQKKSTTKLLCLWLLMVLISTTALGQGKPRKPRPQELENQAYDNASKGIAPPTSGPGFYIGPIQGSPHFSILVSDGSRTVTESITAYQVEVLEAVLVAAKAFALTDEKVGSGVPITTRLMDEREQGFFVDVSKIGNRSRFYVSLSSVTGKVTAPAGEIIRDSKKEQSALFLTILSQVQQAKASINPQ